jgi:hypothetical protein
MRLKDKPFKIAFWVGAAFWLVGGVMNSMIWVPPPPAFHLNVILVFTLVGGVVGMLVFFIFINRPYKKHQQLMTQMDGALTNLQPDVLR